MKARRFFLLLGILCAMICGTNAWGETIPTDPGSTLKNGVIYDVTSNTKIAATTAGQSGLVVEDGAIVYIYIKTGCTLTVTGGDAGSTVGGGAGILLPSSSILYIVGGGTLVATGGNGTYGGQGDNGGNGTINQYAYTFCSYTGGTGGAGGAGGNGAGAGIGTNGATGGSGGASVKGVSGGGTLSTSIDANSANPGTDGKSAASMGKLYIGENIKLTATGGVVSKKELKSSNNGGDSYISAWGNNYYSYGGGGGGNGGAGGAGADIGSGGSGGAGGNSGTGGGASKNGSDTSKGSNGTNGTNGADGSTATPNDQIVLTEANYPKALKATITLNHNEGTSNQNSVTAYYGKTIANVTVPEKKFYSFAGYNDSNNNQIFNANGESQVGESTYTNGFTVNAVWTPKVLNLDEESSVAITKDSYHEVNTKRTINANCYNPLCLPFNLSPKSEWGWTVYEVADMNYDNSNDYCYIKFKEASTIEAGKPYIVYATSGIQDNNFTVNDVDVIATPSSVTQGNITFHGCFAPQEVKNGDIYVSRSTDSPLKFLNNSSGSITINGFRGYFSIDKGASSASAKTIYFDFGGTVTGIETANGDILTDDAPIYNIKGQRVALPSQPGIYVQNGRKFIVK